LEPGISVHRGFESLVFFSGGIADEADQTADSGWSKSIC
jgi:hypothetical protein